MCAITPSVGVFEMQQTLAMASTRFKDYCGILRIYHNRRVMCDSGIVLRDVVVYVTIDGLTSYHETHVPWISLCYLGYVLETPDL